MYPKVLEAQPNIEVTTTFDSTVVDVVHLAPARRRNVWLPFACGALLALVAALSFGRAVSMASADKAAKQAWLAAEKPITEFRPTRLPLAYDLLAALGFFGAVACFGVGTWRAGRGQRSTVVGGNTERADVALASLGSELSLVEATERGAVLCRHPALDLSITDGDVQLSADQALAEGKLTELGDGRVGLQRGLGAVFGSGMTSVFVRETPAPRSNTAAALWSIEGRSAQFFAGSALVHAAALALLWSIPPDASSLALDNGLSSARLARVDAAAFEERQEEPAPDQGDGSSGDAEPGEALMSPPDGQTGEPDKTASKGRFTIARRSDTPQLSRSEAIERARTGGILGIISAGDPFGNMTHGTADFSSGFDLADVRGGIDGDVGAVRGSWGQWGVVGGVGTGPGWGTSKVGKLRWGQGPTGFGSCDPGQVCTGDGPRLRGRVPGKPSVKINPAVSVGGADPSIIRRYIRRKLPRIQHCYERQLISHPNLDGTVTAKFVISPEGAVISSSATGPMGAELNGCVQNAMSSIAFPRFGQIVNVTYPFTFHRAG